MKMLVIQLLAIKFEVNKYGLRYTIVSKLLRKLIKNK